MGTCDSTSHSRCAPDRRLRSFHTGSHYAALRGKISFFVVFATMTIGPPSSVWVVFCILARTEPTWRKLQRHRSSLQVHDEDCHAGGHGQRRCGAQLLVMRKSRRWRSSNKLQVAGGQRSVPRRKLDEGLLRHLLSKVEDGQLLRSSARNTKPKG